MTATEAKAFARLAGGILLALLVPFLLALGNSAWASKESVEHHNADVARISSDVQRILDVVCADKPVARACVPR